MTVDELILVLGQVAPSGDSPVLATYGGVFIKPQDIYVSKDGTVLIDVEGAAGREREYKENGIPGRYRAPKKPAASKSQPEPESETPRRKKPIKKTGEAKA